MNCPPYSQFVFSEKFRFVGSGSFDGAMLPTRASSGRVATPAPPIRLAWISARREIPRLPFASPSDGAVLSRPGETADPPGAGEDGTVSGRRGAVPGRGGALPCCPWRAGASAGAAVPALAGRAWPVPGRRGGLPPWAVRGGAPAEGVVPRRGGVPAGEACGAAPACGRREAPAPWAGRESEPRDAG